MSGCQEGQKRAIDPSWLHRRPHRLLCFRVADLGVVNYRRHPRDGGVAKGTAADKVINPGTANGGRNRGGGFWAVPTKFTPDESGIRWPETSGSPPSMPYGHGQ